MTIAAVLAALSLLSGNAVEELAPENCRPTVPLAVDGWSSGAATFRWDGFPAAGDVAKWRVYAADHPFSDVREEGVTRLAELGRNAREYVAYPLKPKVERHYAVSAVYATGESPKVKSVAHAPVGPLEVKRFRDMLGFNFFWGGGGSNERTSKAYYDVAADFLVDIGIRRIRWWQSPEWAMRDQYLKRGIEICGWTGQQDVAAKYGLYLRDIGNEPELSPKTPAECVEMHRAARERWKALGDDYRFYGPVVNICTRGFDYLKGFVEAGGARYVDAIDLHTYCASTAEFRYPDGYPWGSPEAIFGRVQEIRAYLKEKGVDKPLTCSEWGYSDTRTANPHMQDPTPLRKAQFLVRGCIIHHALDFRRLYMYAFYDEGTDENFSEHLFGVVTRDCQKKPAYFALKNMVKTLGDALVRAKVGGLGAGDYGFLFRNVDGPGCVSVLWNGARARKGVFRTKSASVRIVDLFGGARTVKPKEDGTFLAKFDASPVYFVTDEPVEAVKVEDVKAKPCVAADRLAVSAGAASVAFVEGAAKDLVYSISNPMDEPVKVQLVLRNLAGDVLAERKDEIAAGAAKEFAFAAEMRHGALDEFRLTVDYDADGESFSETCGTWVRELRKTDATVVEEVRFANFNRPLWRISSSAIEVTVDPVQGGQVLDLIDKRTRRNQITTPYAKLPAVSSVPNEYCIWDCLSVRAMSGGKPPYPNFRRQTAFAAEPVAGGLRMAAEDRGIRFAKTIALDGDRMSWSVEIGNGSASQADCVWKIHPEYTVGGTADSYLDYAVFPTAKGEYKLVFWSGLGERLLNDVNEGWWRMADPKAGYEIRQDYGLADFDCPKLWFGIGAWNIEMFTKPRTLQPGETFSTSLDWTFSTVGRVRE